MQVYHKKSTSAVFCLRILVVLTLRSRVTKSAHMLRILRGRKYSRPELGTFSQRLRHESLSILFRLRLIKYVSVRDPASRFFFLVKRKTTLRPSKRTKAPQGAFVLTFASRVTKSAHMLRILRGHKYSRPRLGVFSCSARKNIPAPV